MSYECSSASGVVPYRAVDTVKGEIEMLQLRPNCECCGKDLPGDSDAAYICSFECTFCRSCTEEVLKARCPNCGGELKRRPRRSAEKLQRYPPSGERIVKPGGCGRSAA
jgi:hypothetical protein